MDRLTKRKGGISYSLCENVIIAECENCQNRMPKCYGEDCAAEIKVLKRLAAYEETGLTPEETSKLQEENERLRAELEEAKKCIRDAETYLEMGSGRYTYKVIKKWSEQNG